MPGCGGACAQPRQELPEQHHQPCGHETAESQAGAGDSGARGVPALSAHSQESNFHAMVMPPISESLNRRRKVPSGLLMSRSCACCLLTKPRMALGRAGVSGPGGSGPGSAGQGSSYPSFQCGFRCFFSTSMTPSNHCQKV